VTLAEDALVIGLGGNVGGESAVRARFERACEALQQLGATSTAPLYRSAPLGPVQPAFLNSAVRVRLPDATPDEIVGTVQEIERLLGRDRGSEVRWGPRTIDLDVLLWGTRTIRTPALEVPHPRMLARRFVIEPLIALFGETLVVAGRSLGEHARAVADQSVELVAERW
jgi:2-amino-4-hydroxy-6-hydroxymethyldihydropteridine diphosphokinase